MSKLLDPIQELLRADGWIQASKLLNHALGINESTLYSELLSRKGYFAERGTLTDDGFFFNTARDLHAGTGISEKRQRLAIKNLVNAGLVQVELRGLPAKRFFKIVDDRELIEKILVLGQQKRQKALEDHSLDKRSLLASTKGHTNKNNVINGHFFCPECQVEHAAGTHTYQSCVHQQGKPKNGSGKAAAK